MFTYDGFQIPPGVYCNGSMITKNMPTIADQFSAGVEEVTEFMGSQSQMPVNIFLDRHSNILRLDLTRPLSAEDVKKYGDKPLTYISDSHAGILDIFSSPEHNVIRVRYCDRSMSVIHPSVHPSVRP